jgi:hypothetical protein
MQGTILNLALLMNNSDTNYVHVMAWRTEDDYKASDDDSSLQPYHVDSIAKDDWDKLNKTPEEFAKDHSDEDFFTVFLEFDK